MKTFTRLLMVLSMASVFAACGPDGGDATAPTPDGGPCTGVTPSAAAQQVIGSWKVTAGTANCTCSNGQTVSSAADGTDQETITAGCQPDQVVLYDSSISCPETCTVSGNTITCDPFTCETSGGTEVQTTSDVYTLTNGQLLEVNAAVATTASMTCQCTSNDSVYARIQ